MTEPDLSKWMDYPSGDAQAWEQRYAPLVSEDIQHDTCSEPRLSIVVVAWHSADFIVEALDTIRASQRHWGGPVEVLLMDNGGLESVWSEILLRVDRALRMVGNVHLCRARNLGAALAKAPIVVFLDDDGLILPEHLGAIDRWFQDPEVTAIRGRITFKHHRYFTTLADHYDFGRSAVPDALVTEGNMAIRRSQFLAAGGFNETLSGNEGVDLTFRLKRLDPEAKTLYVPDVVMRHDFVNNWTKFKAKFSRYANIDSTLARLDPGLKDFLAEYLAETKPQRHMRLDERIARSLLSSLKRKLQRRTKKKHVSV